MGAILCSLVILLFLGEWRMTLIAIVTLPFSVLAGIVCLFYTGQTINVMTLAGLTLAIGPMIDSAIICLENTHRHLAMGARPKAALQAPARWPCPSWFRRCVPSWCWHRWPLMPGMGKFLFLPMTLAVMFAMTTSYLLSRTLVPCASAFLLSRHHEPHEPRAHCPGLRRAADADRPGHRPLCSMLDWSCAHETTTVAGSFGLLGCHAGRAGADHAARFLSGSRFRSFRDCRPRSRRERFITEVATPHLNGNYTIFGQCDDATVALVKEIAHMATDPSNDRPFRPVKIIHIKIVRAGTAAARSTTPAKKPAAAATKPE